MFPKAFFLLLLACVGSACVAPRGRALEVRTIPCSKPGWGRALSPLETQMTIRAVEASAAPTTPPTQLGKPGWGRN